MRGRVLVCLSAVFLLASTASAIPRAQDGYYRTGQGVRHKKVGFINAEVYSIASEVSRLPASPTPKGIVDLDADKRLVWRMERSVDRDKIQDALRRAYALNGFKDQAKIDRALRVFGDLPDGAVVVISYDASTQTTTLTTSQGGRATIPGRDFMTATWSIWFGKIDEPKLTRALTKNLG